MRGEPDFANAWWMRFLDKVSPCVHSCHAPSQSPRPQTNAVVTGLTAGFLLYTRSSAVAYFAAGAVVCSLTVKTIKRLVRQPRPVATIRGKRKTSYGYHAFSLLWRDTVEC